MPVLELPRTLRKVLASVFAMMFVVIVFSENLPPAETTTELQRIVPVSRAVGLRQGWGVFAPNPARLEVQTHAIVTFDDGAQAEWYPPSGSLFVGSPRFERWRKWSTRIREDKNKGVWQHNARLIADDVTNSNRQPTSIEMIRRWSTAPLPGEGFAREYGQFSFYLYDPVNNVGQDLTSAGQAAAEPAAEPTVDPAAETPAENPVGEGTEAPVVEGVEGIPDDSVEPPEPIGDTQNEADNQAPNVLPFADSEGESQADQSVDAEAEGAQQ